MNSKKAIQILKNGGVVAVRTDTVYGLIARAADKSAVEKIYEIKQRRSTKQCIVLVSRPDSVPAHSELIEFYSALEETPTSIVVTASVEPDWLLRGGDSMAYRLIKEGVLKEIIDAVGPVVAPSANPEGSPPARTAEQAREYFGSKVDFYIDGGEVPANISPSQIILIDDNGSVTKLR